MTSIPIGVPINQYQQPLNRTQFATQPFMQQQQPQFTQPVQQPQFTQPVQQPQFTQPVQQPALQPVVQPVPVVETPAIVAPVTAVAVTSARLPVWFIVVFSIVVIGLIVAIVILFLQNKKKSSEVVGPKGAQGFRGEIGITGNRGTQGIQGSGLRGFQGLSATGAQGSVNSNIQDLTFTPPTNTTSKPGASSSSAPFQCSVTKLNQTVTISGVVNAQLLYAANGTLPFFSFHVTLPAGYLLGTAATPLASTLKDVVSFVGNAVFFSGAGLNFAAMPLLLSEIRGIGQSSNTETSDPDILIDNDVLDIVYHSPANEVVYPDNVGNNAIMRCSFTIVYRSA
jgi:hypothetical protein